MVKLIIQKCTVYFKFISNNIPNNINGGPSSQSSNSITPQASTFNESIALMHDILKAQLKHDYLTLNEFEKLSTIIKQYGKANGIEFDTTTNHTSVKIRGMSTTTTILSNTTPGRSPIRTNTVDGNNMPNTSSFALIHPQTSSNMIDGSSKQINGNNGNNGNNANNDNNSSGSTIQWRIYTVSVCGSKIKQM